MMEAEAQVIENDVEETSVSRIYEVGYTIVPSVKEDDVEKVVGEIRSQIETAGGSFIAEGAPSMTRLSYEMGTRENGKHVEHDRGYFGWIKFEASTAVVEDLHTSLKRNASVMRFIVFRTVREDTRAKIKAPTLREVKRTDTIKTSTRKTEEPAGPVSEEELEKAIQDITTE